MYIAEKGLEALELIADNGGWDDVSDVASELNKTVEELSEVYFEMEEDDEVTASELNGKKVYVTVYCIHKGDLVEVYKGPAIEVDSKIYFDYEFNELDECEELDA